jgi:hypothetical protein
MSVFFPYPISKFFISKVIMVTCLVFGRQKIHCQNSYLLFVMFFLMSNNIRAREILYSFLMKLGINEDISLKQELHNESRIEDDEQTKTKLSENTQSQGEKTHSEPFEWLRIVGNGSECPNSFFHLG